MYIQRCIDKCTYITRSQGLMAHLSYQRTLSCSKGERLIQRTLSSSGAGKGPLNEPSFSEAGKGSLNEPSSSLPSCSGGVRFFLSSVLLWRRTPCDWLFFLQSRMLPPPKCLSSEEEASSKWSNRGCLAPEEDPLWLAKRYHMTLNWKEGSFRGCFLLPRVLLWKRMSCDWLFLLILTYILCVRPITQRPPPE